MVILGGLHGSPYLVVGADGKVKAVNQVQVKDCERNVRDADRRRAVHSTAARSSSATSSTPATPTSAMEADNDIDNRTYLTSTKGNANQPWPMFEFRDTLDAVTILNYSSHKLTIGKIDLVNDLAGQGPLVTLKPNRGVSTTFEATAKLEFDVQHAAAPSYVDIEQRAATAFELELSALVNNPVGLTRIVNLQGSILGAGTIVTNLLDAYAPADSIGSSTQRLTIDLIQFFRRPFLGGPMIGSYRAPRIYVRRRCRRVPEPPRRRPDERVSRVIEMTIGVDRISAGRDVDLELRTTVRQPGTAVTADVDVQVPNETSNFGSIWVTPKPHDSHFRGQNNSSKALYDPDRTGWNPFRDPSTTRWGTRSRALPARRTASRSTASTTSSS